MHSDMESQIHILEQEAYGAVLRAFKAQSDALTWDKESLITELRKELRVSDDEHRELLTKVNGDALIHRIREWRQAGGSIDATANLPQPVHDQLISPTFSASRKRQKTSQSGSFGTPSQTLHSQSIAATTQASALSAKRGPASGTVCRRPHPGQPVLSSPPPIQYQRTNQGSGAVFTNELPPRICDPLVGRKVMTRWPGDSNFYEAIITDYSTVEGRHALVYDINTPNETLEWVDLKEIPPEDIRWIGDDPGISRGTGTGGQVLVGNAPIPGRERGSSRDQVENQARPSQNGVAKKVFEEIEILHTDTLIEKVEKVINASHPDLLEIQKAKKLLKEHEQALLDVISKLADACERSDDEQPLHRQSVNRDYGLQNVHDRDHDGSNVASEMIGGRVRNYDMGRGQIAFDGHEDDEVVI